MSSTIYVIIPYYQREAGILRRALDSIARQEGPITVRVIVVDDSSPVSAVDELAGSALDPACVEIVSQPNAGPGFARSRGLDRVGPEADFVAFLDSDDEWAPSHLHNACNALGQDLDFYFSNHREPDAACDRFAQHGRLDLSHHTPLPRGSSCYRFQGDMIEQIIFANVIETSTVVYRWVRLQHLRFRADFRSAYEDILFWISAAQSSRGIAFSTDVECQYGRGVSIWRSSAFGSDRTLPRLIDERRYYQEVRRYCMAPQQIELVDTRIGEIRQAVIADVLHRTRRRLGLDFRSLARFVRVDPPVLLLALPLGIRIAFRRLTKQRSPGRLENGNTDQSSMRRGRT